MSESYRYAPAQVRAAFVPSTFDEAARTVEVVWTTGAAVRRVRWRGWEPEEYDETLEVSPKAIRLERLQGASVLDNHRSYEGLECVIGRVESAWLQGGEGRARLRLSSRESVAPIVHDIHDGIIGHVSMGYRVWKFEDRTAEGDKVKKLHAVDWEPYELSFVTIPADAGAGVRAAQPEATYSCVVERARDMRNRANFGAGVETETRASDQAPREGAAPQPSAPYLDAFRAEAAPQPQPTTPDLEAVRAEAVRAERERVHEIEEHCRALSMSEDSVRRLVALGRPLQGILRELRDEHQRANAAARASETEIATRITVGTEDIEKKRAVVSGAIAQRLGADVPQQDAEARAFANRPLLDLMRLAIEARDGARDAWRLGRDEVITRAMHATSDFPNLLQEAGARTLREQFDKHPVTYPLFTRAGTLRNFRATGRVALGDAPAMKLVPEAAEIQSGTMGESAEPIMLARYGRAVELTFEAIVNDDLEAFAGLLARQARSTQLLVESLVYAQLTAGTVGGASIYSTSNPNRKNYIEGAGALSVLTADANGIKALNRLTSLMESQSSDDSDGADYLNLAPRFLIVPTTLGHTAHQLVAPIAPTSVAEVNVHRGKLEVISNPRLNSAPAVWYLAADPAMFDTIEVAWLDGHVGPTFVQESNFRTGGVSYACWATVAAKVIDWRGLAKSKGAT